MKISIIEIQGDGRIVYGLEIADYDTMTYDDNQLEASPAVKKAVAALLNVIKEQVKHGNDKHQ